MREFDRVSEVIRYAEDVTRLTEFYTGVFDFEIAAGDPAHGFVRFDTGDCSLCLHAGRDADLGDYPTKVVFAVDDVDAAREYLLDRDVEMGDIRSPAPGTRVCDGRDPEGNPFSIESTD
ncbi:VOC family protein [Halovivax limisalsi]|uniref:VOC family protein n=1 Tax=Halovivax limisalsi TaxID=1453760 RepID=UPI001FFC7844|nr:VOC family protein [Halovivax limisalsi]